jgi:PAS domain S-box-containing protein
MRDEGKTKAALISELKGLRREIASLEKNESEQRKAEAEYGEYYRRIEDMVEERTAEIRIANRQLQAEIDQRKRAEEALQVIAGQWRETLDAINDAIWLMDLDQKIIRCNKAAARLLKKDYSKIIGKKCYELFHGTLMSPNGCPFLAMYRSKRKQAVKRHFGDKWFNVSLTPLKDRRGKIVGVVHIAKDITEEKWPKQVGLG